MTTTEAFKALYDTVAKLRGPGGCPWDIEQTPSSLREALIEETYECIEAIDENNPAHIAEELGDLFLLATMLAYMHEEKGIFTVADALTKINEKLIRRHPHVFNGLKVKDSSQVLENWAAIKAEQEGRGPKNSILDEVSSGLPPMDRSYALQKKAAKAGFDWPDTEGVITKIREELEEAREAINARETSLQNARETAFFEGLQDAHNEQETALAAKILEEELGDLLFSVVNLCRYLKVEPSVALRRTNSKFVHRFKYVEKKMKESGQEMKKENLDIMDTFWNEVKTL